MEQLIKIGDNIYYKNYSTLVFVQVFGIKLDSAITKYLVLTSSKEEITDFDNSILSLYESLLNR